MRTQGGQEGGKCKVLVRDRGDELLFYLVTILEGTYFRFCTLQPNQLAMIR
jgi:hypothetical protein